MVKWWHRAKVAFVCVPLMVLFLFVMLLCCILEAFAGEWWDDARSAWNCIRDEWRHGWIPDNPWENP